MKKVKKLITEADAPQATPTEATSKAALMANVLDSMGRMSQMDLTYLFNMSQELIGKEADSIPPGTAERNLQSVNSQNAVVSEELKTILETETLSEETKEKAKVLFESAVNTQVSLKTAEIEDAHAQLLTEEVDNIIETLTEQVDRYLTYVAEQWMKQNKVEVDRTIRTELAESFITNFHKLLSEHYVSIPEDQVDAVDALTEHIAELKEQLDQQINENLEYKNRNEEFERENALKEVSSGLAMTQVEKLRSLAEGYNVNDVENYKKKLKILRETHFDKKTKTSNMLTEDVVSDEKETNEGIDRLANYIARSVKT